MKSTADSVPPRGEWTGSVRPVRPGGRWSRFLWSLIYPTTNQRVMPTVSGLALIGLALGIGSAAYNAANNILFITLSLLLACLILSGVMSWVNLRRVSWLLHVPRPLRAGQAAPVTLELHNGKSLVPVYGLWFELAARLVAAGPRRPEATIRANSGQFSRAALTTARISRGFRTLNRSASSSKSSRVISWNFPFTLIRCW